jgi:SPOR domain
VTDTDRELNLQDEDRLPWLEAVETDEEDEGVGGSKLVLTVFAMLLGIGVLVGGMWWLNNQKQAPSGDGTLIAAQEGNYKVKPEEPGGMKVEGQGDASFAASEGAEANGKVDMSATTEAPVAVVKENQVAAAKPAPAPAAKPAVSAPIAAPAAPKPLTAPAPTGGGLVQLGAYGSTASAEEAWTKLSARTPALARLSKSVLPAAVGGKTLYRLRANAGSPAAAAALCAQVGNCIVVK